MRKASSRDISKLVDFMSEFYAEGGYPLNRQSAADAFAGLLADARLGQVWFIQAEGVDVGHLVITYCFSMEYGGVIACVDDLFVRSPFRRAGHAARGLREAQAHCLANGVRAMRVETGHDNVAARGAYARAGFKELNRLLLSRELADPTHVG